MSAAVPEVSALVPTYNGAAFIGETIRSLLAQTLREIEVVVVDDGSADGTAGVVERIGDPRVRLVRHERNLGLAAARRTAMEAARGRYLAWLDHDDLARPRRLERQAAFLDATPSVALVGSWAGKVDGRGRRLKGVRVTPFEPEDVRAWLLFRPACQQPSILGRAEVLRAHPPREEVALCDDHDVWLRISERHRIGNLPEVLVDRRIHPGQTTRDRRDRVLAQRVEVIRGPLAALGVEASEEDLRRHATLGKSRFEEPVGPERLDWLEDWLLRLRGGDLARAGQDREALRFATGAFWFMGCVAAGRQMGRGPAVRRFVRSPLAAGGMSRRGRAWLARAAPAFLAERRGPGRAG